LPDVDGVRGDSVGWQLQGTQFRLFVETFQHELLNSANRPEREKYIQEQYASWFEFGLLEEVVGVGAPRANEVRGGRSSFQGYNPGFAYRYRDAPNLSPAEIIRVGIAYLERAAHIEARTA
jgi:hypothetical protein